MGQYYAAVVEINGKPTGFDPVEFQGAKLMEHSWWRNKYVNAIAKMIFDEPHKVAWVGDYATEENGYTAPCTEEMYQAAHVNETVKLPLEEEFELSELYLVNHSKKEYLDCDRYYNAVNGKGELGEGWVAHPIPLLTAIGNGRGGGDYRGVNKSKVGCWAWDMLSLETSVPEGYNEFFVEFVD